MTAEELMTIANMGKGTDMSSYEHFMMAEKSARRPSGVDIAGLAIGSTALLAEIITFHSKKNVVLNCSKCLTFWTTLGYSLFITGQGVIPSLFYSFTLAYLALWVELLLNVFNYYYTKSYGKIYQAEDDTTSSSESDKLP